MQLFFVQDSRKGPFLATEVTSQSSLPREEGRELMPVDTRGQVLCDLLLSMVAVGASNGKQLAGSGE